MMKHLVDIGEDLNLVFWTVANSYVILKTVVPLYSLENIPYQLYNP